MLAEKVAHQPGDFIAIGFQREVTGVDQMDRQKLPCGFDNSTLNCRECVPVASPPRARKNELLEGLEAEVA